MVKYVKLHHASHLVDDIETAVAFYRDVLGMEISHERPNLGFPGAWLSVGDQQIHLLELPDPDGNSVRPEHAGRDRHTALQVRGLDDIVTALNSAGIPFTRSRSGRQAVFVRDPDGNGIELIEMV